MIHPEPYEHREHVGPSERNNCKAICDDMVDILAYLHGNELAQTSELGQKHRFKPAAS